MSDEKPKAEAGEGAAKPKGGKPIKLFAIVGALMVVEAAGVYALVGLSNKQPASAAAMTLEHGEAAKSDAMVELTLVEEQFQNMQTGRVWVWDAAISLRVKKKFEEQVQKKLDEREAELREGVATIFRRATFAQLKEPGLETLNRQVLSFVDGILGKSESEGEPASFVDRVLIPKCRGFPAD